MNLTTENIELFNFSKKFVVVSVQLLSLYFPVLSPETLPRGESGFSLVPDRQAFDITVDADYDCILEEFLKDSGWQLLIILELYDLL